AGFRRLGRDVPHPAARPLYTEAFAWIVGRIPVLGELLQLGIARRHVYFDADELVAALAVLRPEAAVLEAHDLARRRALGDCEHHGALGRRHLYLGAEHGLLEADGKSEADIVALAGEEAVRRDFDRHDCIAPTGRPFLALAGKTDLRPVFEARRQ